MSEHIHGCLTCRPDMVPDFDADDPRYHKSGKCSHSYSHGPAMVDGIPVSYTNGVFEGPEGWALFAGATTADIHKCACGTWSCVEPRFGHARGEH
jgi:hypothetical protein